MLAHAEVVDGAPDHDLSRAAGRMQERAGKLPGDPFELGELTVAALAPQPREGVREVFIIVHDPSPERSVRRSHDDDQVCLPAPSSIACAGLLHLGGSYRMVSPTAPAPALL